MQYAIRNIHAYEVISSLELSSDVTSQCREITDSSLNRNATLLFEKDSLLHINGVLSQEKDALVTAHETELDEHRNKHRRYKRLCAKAASTIKALEEELKSLKARLLSFIMS